MNELYSKIFDAAKPHLEGLYLKDMVIGISLIGIELSDGSVGVTYTFRNELPNGCGACSGIKNLLGESAVNIAKFLVSSDDPLERGIADAIICAVANKEEDLVDDNSGQTFGLEFNEGDEVAMIGLIGPVAKKIMSLPCKLYIFDMDQYEDNMDLVLPMDKQEELVGRANKLIVTGSSVVNGTLESLLDMAKNAEEIVIVGPSTPMYKEAFLETKVTRLAGSLWMPEKKEEIFKEISLGAGVKQLKNFVMQKYI